MRYRLRTLLIVAAILPVFIGVAVVGYRAVDSWVKQESWKGVQRGQAAAAANAFETRDNGDGTFTMLMKATDGTVSKEVRHYSRK